MSNQAYVCGQSGRRGLPAVERLSARVESVTSTGCKAQLLMVGLPRMLSRVPGAYHGRTIVDRVETGLATQLSRAFGVTAGCIVADVFMPGEGMEKIVETVSRIC